MSVGTQITIHEVTYTLVVVQSESYFEEGVECGVYIEVDDSCGNQWFPGDVITLQ